MIEIIYNHDFVLIGICYQTRDGVNNRKKSILDFVGADHETDFKYYFCIVVNCKLLRNLFQGEKKHSAES